MKNDGTLDSITYPGGFNLDWDVVQIADFNGDKVYEIFGRNGTMNNIWLMDNGGASHTDAFPEVLIQIGM